MDVGKRRNRHNFLEVFKMYKTFTKIDICELYTKDLDFKSTRGHTLKLEKPGCTRDAMKFFYLT